MKRLGISGLFLKPGQVGGAEEMLRGLLVGWAACPDLKIYLFLPQGTEDWIRDPRIEVIYIPLIRNRFWTELLHIPRLCQEKSIEYFFFPNYFTPPFWGTRPRLITAILDLNYVHFPGSFSWQKKLWLRAVHFLTLWLSDLTTVISQYVQEDIIKHYGSYFQTKAIYIPIDWERFQIVQPPVSEVKNPFILSVAHHYPHKNLITLIKAFALLAAVDADIHLVLVGQRQRSLVGIAKNTQMDVLDIVDQLHLRERVHLTGYITDPELAWYYHHAEIFAFPSLFEGFGLPPVEALGMGLPVLTTACTSLEEVTLGYAHYVRDPLNVQMWFEQLRAMRRDPQSYRPTSDHIEKIRSTYDPRTIAQQYLDAFAGIPSRSSAISFQKENAAD